MVIQDLLNQIQALGYSVELKSNSIKFTYTKGNQPPKEAILILKQFKDRKQEVLKHLQKANKPEPPPELRPEQFEATFLNAVDDIAKQYIPGTIGYARKTNPKGYENSIKVENRLNQLWDDGKDLEAFQKAASEWKLIQLEMIRLFKE